MERELLNAEDFGWELEEYMTGSLDSQRRARIRANIPRFYPQPCKACAAGFHSDPAYSCSCPCHEITTEVRRAA